MMPTSASFPPAENAGGFTLLELLIVLAIISTAAALVVPRLQSTYEAIVRSGERADVRQALERLPLLTRAGGSSVDIGAGPKAEEALAGYLAVPAGWRVTPLTRVRIHASGMCEESRVLVSGRDTRETWRLSAPLCAVDDVQVR